MLVALLGRMVGLMVDGGVGSAVYVGAVVGSSLGGYTGTSLIRAYPSLLQGTTIG